MQKQKIKYYFFALSLVFSMLALAGCGKTILQKAGEKSAEKIIESQTGGKANVDIDGENIKVETKEGKMEAGEDVKLPEDFPKDVYIIEGKIKSVISTAEASQGHSISIETDKSIEEAKSSYQDKLKSDGWEITATMNIGESATVIGEKENRSVSIMIGKGENKTSVTIIVANKE